MERQHFKKNTKVNYNANVTPDKANKKEGSMLTSRSGAHIQGNVWKMEPSLPDSFSPSSLLQDILGKKMRHHEYFNSEKEKWILKENVILIQITNGKRLFYKLY